MRTGQIKIRVQTNMDVNWLDCVECVGLYWIEGQVGPTDKKVS